MSVSPKPSDEEYEVEELIDLRYVDEEPEYLIKWKGHPSSKNTWEPERNLNCPSLVRKFHASLNYDRITTVHIPTGNEPYGFDRGLTPDFISMVTQKDNELYFLIKWKGKQLYDVVPATQANTRCPQLVIKFYESILRFS